MIVDKINSYLYQKDLHIDDYLRYEVEKLAGWAFKRQFMETAERSKTIRISSLGKCQRAQAYQYHGFEVKGKEIDGRGRITFFTGDLTELLITQLAKLSGVAIIATGFGQMTLNISINGDVITGHPDGIVFCEDKKLRLYECKSFSDYAFKSFERKEIDESYLVQINCYMKELGLSECVLVGLNKNNGVLAEQVLEFDKKYTDIANDNYKKIASSTPDDLPEQPYSVDEKGYYPWQCLYCGYFGWCRPNAERVLVGKAYKLKEKNEHRPNSAKN